MDAPDLDPDKAWYEDDGIEVTLKFRVRGISITVEGFESKDISREKVAALQACGWELFKQFYSDDLKEKLEPVGVISIENKEDALAKPVLQDGMKLTFNPCVICKQVGFHEVWCARDLPGLPT